MDRDLSLLGDLGLKLTYVMNTHAHADHITSSGAIKKKNPGVKSVISLASGAKADILLEAVDKVSFGNFCIDSLATPGHTNGCVTYVLPGSPPKIFTGDTLLIRGCGRTDFQQGDASLLYDNVHSKIFSMPEETLIYPGHDYKVVETVSGRSRPFQSEKHEIETKIVCLIENNTKQ